MSAYITTVRSRDRIDMTCRFEARSGSQAKEAIKRIEEFASRFHANDLLDFGYEVAPKAPLLRAGGNLCPPSLSIAA